MIWISVTLICCSIHSITSSGSNPGRGQKTSNSLSLGAFFSLSTSQTWWRSFFWLRNQPVLYSCWLWEPEIDTQPSVTGIILLVLSHHCVTQRPQSRQVSERGRCTKFFTPSKNNSFKQMVIYHEVFYLVLVCISFKKKVLTAWRVLRDILYYKKRGKENNHQYSVKNRFPNFPLVNSVSESKKQSSAEQNPELWHFSCVVAD